MKTETGTPPTAATAGVRPQWHLWALAFSLALMLPACGGDSPTSPSSRIPSVAGTYTGPLNFTADGVQIATLSTQMNVVQSGSQLTITGSVSFSGQTIQLPAVTGNVNETGFFTATSGGAASEVSDPDCGLITTTSFTLAFSGNTARYVEIATTTSCGLWNLSGTLTR